MLKISLMVFALLLSSQKVAAKDRKIDFELARIDGSKFISNQNFIGKKTALIFFDIDCPPCVKKLNNLKEQTPDLVSLNIVVINLSVRKEAKNFILNLGLDPQIELLQAPSNPRVFLRKFGNNSGALPYLTLLNQDGSFCLAKSEMFSDSDLKKCN